ncbi:MAG: ATP-dependent Clp protease ATP-binding subunit [Clostridiales bacterium]|nr:ATP-dependent Clp protease ATP-binding subunit [Clostridiales bacterium]
MQSETLQSVYEFANRFARNLRLSELKSEHVLYALTVIDNETWPFLKQFDLDSTNIEPRLKGYGGILHNSPEVDELNDRALTIAGELDEANVNCIHILLAMLTMNKTYAYEKIAFILGKHSQKPSDLFFAIAKELPNGAKLRNLGIPKNITVEHEDEPHFEEEDPIDDVYETTFDSIKSQRTEDRVIQYGIDLTERALLGGIDPVIGRDLETERVIQTLTRRTKNNPVLIGEAGVGKTAVVEGLAMCMSMGKVPVELQRKRLIQLDMASMVAGTRYRGDFEERLTNLVKQVIDEGDIILFIDEIHNMVGAGGTSTGAMDAAEILKPALARGDLHVIGATTTREYRMYIEKDPALERRFQPITVEEPSPELAMEIVKGVKSKYESHHGVVITDDAIETAVQLSVRYVTDRYLPDKAFDIIDEACSKLKITEFQVPRELVELTNNLKAVKRKLEAARNNKDIAQIQALQMQYNDLHLKYEYEQADYQQQVREYKCVLTSEYVRQVVSQMTGVPVSELSRKEMDKLVHLEDELSARVIGQDEAVKVVSRAVRRQRAGLKDPNRPIGGFIFVGPTGVGKTELAKALSECLFGKNCDIIRIDMSEYMEKASVAKLIGAPPGYVGYEESGYLTEKVLRKPYSVVLFDEIEKAHPDVFNLLLQILDEGRLTDSHGKTIDFRNTVIILTSNIGMNELNGSAIGFGSHGDFAAMQDSIDRALKRFFRPEFLNRLDEIVTFNYLGKAEMVRIAELMCFSLYTRLQGVINLQFTERAIQFLATDGFDRNYGARPLKRTIQRKVEDVLAEKILTGEINKGDIIRVDALDGKITFTKLAK